MKILIITPGIHPVPPVKGGAVENLIDFILKDNIDNEITIYSIYEKNIETSLKEYNNIKFKFIKKNKFLELIFKYSEKIYRKFFNVYIGNYFVNKVYKSLKITKEEYDIIIIENMPKYILKLNNVLGNGKKVLHLHNDYLYKNTFKDLEILELYDNIICVSNFIKNRVSTINTSTDKIYTLYNGIKLNQTKLQNEETIYSKYKIKKNKINIIYTGRMVKDKGIENLVNAFCDFNNDNYQLILVGGCNYGENKDNSFILKLKKRAQNNNVIFTGYINYSEIINLYNISDIGCLPSIVNEACPLTAIEMITMGLPVIGTNSGGLPEIIDNTCGVIINREELTKNLLKVFNDIDNNLLDIKDMKKNAIIKSKNFSLEKYQKNFWNIIKKICNN